MCSLVRTHICIFLGVPVVFTQQVSTAIESMCISRGLVYALVMTAAQPFAELRLRVYEWDDDQLWHSDEMSDCKPPKDCRFKGQHSGHSIAILGDFILIYCQETRNFCYTDKNLRSSTGECFSWSGCHGQIKKPILCPNMLNELELVVIDKHNNSLYKMTQPAAAPVQLTTGPSASHVQAAFSFASHGNHFYMNTLNGLLHFDL